MKTQKISKQEYLNLSSQKEWRPLGFISYFDDTILYWNAKTGQVLEKRCSLVLKEYLLRTPDSTDNYDTCACGS